MVFDLGKEGLIPFKGRRRLENHSERDGGKKNEAEEEGVPGSRGRVGAACPWCNSEECSVGGRGVRGSAGGEGLGCI